MVAKAAYQVKSAIAAPNSDGRELHPVEGMGFDHGVVHHVQEDQIIPRSKGLRESVIAHLVAGQTGLTAQAVKVRMRGRGLHLRP